MEITGRTIVRQLTETHYENGQPLDRLHRVAFVAAVVENPYPAESVQ